MSNGKLYGILSDIHGNEEAFRTVLEYMTGLAVNEIYSLGDLVGYGQGAKTCYELAEKYNVTCIQGNHDAMVQPPRDPRMRAEAQAALDLAETQLSDEQMKRLASLPTQRIIDNRMVLVHGALTGRDDYILSQDALQTNMGKLIEDFVPIKLCFFGHTHLGMVAGNGGIRSKFPESDVIDLNPSRPYLINPGSVGQPRDGNPKSSFVLYNSGDNSLTIIRLEYDVATEQKRMEEANLPEKLWKRIAVGK